MPATTALAIQLRTATRSGDTPLSTAPVGVSATALVSRPKRVWRYTIVSTTVSTRTETASKVRSDSAVTSPHCHRSTGKIGATLTGALPTWFWTRPERMTSTPSDATVFASWGACRKGRNTTR